MDYRFQATSDAVEVFLGGKLTMRDHEAFLTILERLRAETAPRIVLDLSGVNFVDSAGLGLLLLAREHGRERSRTVVLRRPRSHVLRLLELGDFRRVMTIEA